MEHIHRNGNDGLPSNGMRVLMANEPRSYREAISGVIAQLRPGMEIFTARAPELDHEFSRIRPDLVLCSGLTETIEREAPAWIELHPDGDSRALVSLGKDSVLYPDMDFERLLSIFDRVESSRGRH